MATNDFRGGTERTEYHPCVAWDRLAEICGQFLWKSQVVDLEGPARDKSIGPRRVKLRLDLADKTARSLDGSGEIVAPHQDGTPDRVLLIDDDADIADVVRAMLTDEGYVVGVLVDTSHQSIMAAVGMQEPDCILLDGSHGAEYGSSWAEAAYLAARERSVPTIMFSAHAADVREAKREESHRALAAEFAAVLGKPFSLDELIEAVASACGRSEPFNQSAAGDRERTLQLSRRLRELGAKDIRTSDRREWATFRRTEDDAICQLYWWQRMGLYVVGRYREDSTLTSIGQFFELEAAIAAAMPDASS